MIPRLHKRKAIKLCFFITFCVGSQIASAASVNDLKIQVCLPNKRIFFEDVVLDTLVNHPSSTHYSEEELKQAPHTIRRVADSDLPDSITHRHGVGFGAVLNQRGGLSAGSGGISIKSSTEKDQPVYQTGYGHPLSTYVAASVTVHVEPNNIESSVTYWYQLPKDTPVGRFTEWFEPVSMETWQQKSQGTPARWRLTHGQSMPIYPVSANAPKMRYAVEDTASVEKTFKTDFLPALSTARLKFRTPTSDSSFVYQFVPKTNEVIPACN